MGLFTLDIGLWILGTLSRIKISRKSGVMSLSG